MSHRVPLPLAVRRSLFVLLTVACGLLATGTVRAEPYRHTVLIDGVLDFTGGEIFATTSPYHDAYTTWDDSHLYLGFQGTDIGPSIGSPQTYLVIYIDTDSMGAGAGEGRTFNTQTPAMPAGFAPNFVLYTRVDGQPPVLQVWDGAQWTGTPYSIDCQWTPNFVEMSVNFGYLGGATDGLRLVFCLVHEQAGGEWTYAGCPPGVFSEGYDPDIGDHLPCDLLSSLPPNQQGTETEIHVTPLPAGIAAPWELYGPDSYFTTGTGSASLVGVAVGDYTIVWLPLVGWLEPAGETQALDEGGLIEFSGTYLPAPAITSVADVPNDQGRRLRLVWDRIVYDAPGQGVTITGYEVYRRQDAKPAGSPTSAGSEKLAGWDWLATVPAHGDSSYQYVAATLCDSTAEAGICWTVYRLRAVTPDPFAFYTSPADSGYSVDNLAPGVPRGIMATYQAGGVVLDWEDAPEADFRYYRIYRGADPGFTPDPDHLIHEIAASAWTDPTADPWSLHYKITALDHAGNESGAGSPESLSGAPSAAPAGRTALLDAVPNPFNPATTLSFSLASAGHVRLDVYDLVGRRVTTLVDEHRAAGRYEAVWRGRDARGRMCPAGLYLYRLQAGGLRWTKRMMLIK